MCIKKLKALFNRKPKAEARQISLSELRWKSLKLFKAIGRLVKTSRGGLNMPRHQPCPQCGAGAKRQEKTLGGARYWCRRCGVGFFVRQNAKGGLMAKK